MSVIWEYLVKVVEWFWDLLKDCIEAFWDFCVDVICYLFDKTLQVAVDLAGSLDVSSLNIPAAWTALPADVLNILGLCGFGQCMGIIAGAIMIRLTLQLIPFVRLGS